MVDNPVEEDSAGNNGPVMLDFQSAPGAVPLGSNAQAWYGWLYGEVTEAVLAEDLHALECYCTEALLDTQLPPFLRAKFELISSLLPGRNPRQHLNEALESIEGMRTKLRANGLEDPEILTDLISSVEARAVNIRNDELEAEAAGVVLSDYNPGTVGGGKFDNDDDADLEDDVVGENVEAGGSDEENDVLEGAEAGDGCDVVSEDDDGEASHEENEGSEAEDGGDVGLQRRQQPAEQHE